MFGNNKVMAHKTRIHDFAWIIFGSSSAAAGNVSLHLQQANLSEVPCQRSNILEMGRHRQPF